MPLIPEFLSKAWHHPWDERRVVIVLHEVPPGVGGGGDGETPFADTTGVPGIRSDFGGSSMVILTYRHWCR